MPRVTVGPRRRKTLMTDESAESGVGTPSLGPKGEPVVSMTRPTPPDHHGDVPLRQALEAVLLVADEPVGDVLLAQVLARPRTEVTDALIALAAAYDDEQRGFELRRAAGGWRLYTRAVCAPVVERYVLDGQSARLTQAALETLTIVAYRQPVSRARVAGIRAVNSDGVMRTLSTRGLIAEVGNDGETGAILYGTTRHFLERLGLDDVIQLPSLAPLLPEMDDLEQG